MKKILSNYFQGDRTIWALTALLMLFSIMPVFSASTNLVYVVKAASNPVGILLKHFMHIIIGLVIICAVHKVSLKSVRLHSAYMWMVALILMIMAIFQGTVIGGANASRWVKIPIFNFTFQPSSLGWTSIILYLSWFFWWSEDKKDIEKVRDYYIWIPIAFVFLFTFPANLSTAMMILFMCVMLLFVAKYPIKKLMKVGLVLLIIGAVGVLTIKAFPELAPSRMRTWVARIDRFGSEDKNQDRYQIENAKIAIAQGEIFGVGPGKSTQKNMLPQSTSDFIYAIIVEEYGFLGGFAVIVIYMVLAYRFIKICSQTKNKFEKYMVFGLGFSIIFQALINIGVAVELFPTTGQPLPLVSTGGTSVWVTCISIGLILGVSRTKEQVRKQEIENQRKQEEFKMILEEQMNKNTIDDSNPMSAVMKD